tara:strand:+ start:113 stop:274 length:162 start_codon:yes stop_codon:yes gene_type:complete
MPETKTQLMYNEMKESAGLARAPFSTLKAEGKSSLPLTSQMIGLPNKPEEELR